MYFKFEGVFTIFACCAMLFSFPYIKKKKLKNPRPIVMIMLRMDLSVIGVLFETRLQGASGHSHLLMVTTLFSMLSYVISWTRFFSLKDLDSQTCDLNKFLFDCLRYHSQRRDVINR